MKRAEAAVIARAVKAAKTLPMPDRFWSKVDKRSDSECWPWIASVRRKEEGYGAFWLNGRHQPANRVALMLDGRPVPDEMVACHSCDNPRCCNPAHLFIGSPKENNDDKVRKSRHSHGERHGMARLTNAQRAEILQHMPPPGGRAKVGANRQLAERFGITAQYVSELYGKHRSAT